jgi:hypothetical protein
VSRAGQDFIYFKHRLSVFISGIINAITISSDVNGIDGQLNPVSTACRKNRQPAAPGLPRIILNFSLL